MFNEQKKLIWTSVFAAAIVREFYDRASLKGNRHAIDQMPHIMEEAAALADITIENITIIPERFYE